jgi:hypothetical protein
VKNVKNARVTGWEVRMTGGALLGLKKMFCYFLALFLWFLENINHGGHL